MSAPPKSLSLSEPLDTIFSGPPAHESPGNIDCVLYNAGARGERLEGAVTGMTAAISPAWVIVKT